ncbi:MAG: DUF6775 family putative metallopeptidase [Terriglobia bacterium]
MAGRVVRAKSVYVYEEPRSAHLDLSDVASYVRDTTGVDVVIRPSLVGHALNGPPETRSRIVRALAEQFVGLRAMPNGGRKTNAVEGEIEYETRRLADESRDLFGFLYDGYRMTRLFADLLERAGEDLRDPHIVLTNQLVGTWDDGDRRYHARTGVFGFPAIISTTGLVEAPGKPREYYFLKSQVDHMSLGSGLVEAFLEERRDQILAHGDSRSTDVIKGIVLQALSYHFRGDAFCADRNCRLFNAHWQSDLLEAQLGGAYDLCTDHRNYFAKMGGAAA